MPVRFRRQIRVVMTVRVVITIQTGLCIRPRPLVAERVPSRRVRRHGC